MPELRQQTLQLCVLQLFSPEGAGSCCRIRMFSLEQLQLLKQFHFYHLSCIVMDSLHCQMQAMWNMKHQRFGSKKGNVMVQKEDCSQQSQGMTGNWGVAKGSAAVASETAVLAHKVDGDTAGRKKNFQMH